MKKKYIKIRFRLPAIGKLLTLFLSAVFLFSQFSLTLAANSPTGQAGYEIKLADGANYQKLVQVGSNIRLRFAGTNDSQFQNVYTFESSYPLSSLQQLLQGDFAYLEPSQNMQANAVVLNDPGFTSDTQNVDKQWYLPKAGFDSAWQKTTGNANNVVGVIDTGIDETHQDLKSVNFLPGFNFVTNQPISAGINSDDNGHGTLVAGILGATPNNGVGVAGTNWQISVMPLKALDSTGKGDAAAVAEAIVWATDHGVQFINLSLGGVGFGHDTTLANAITYAFNKNVLIVAAAGNDSAINGSNLDQNPVFPICDDNNYNMVLGVAATDQNDLKPDFSNYGHNCIDVSAPGKRILSTINFDPLSKSPAPNSYAYGSGTSLAVPLVVGQAALIRALYPSATNIQIRDRIISTADPIDDLNLSQCGGGSCRGLLGSGRINVFKSLENTISQTFSEGDLVKVTDVPGVVYQIVGGQKRLVSPFVFNQRFSATPYKSALLSQLSAYPEGAYITPTDGTLVKFDADPSVYIMQNGQKSPITYQVFMQRRLNFGNVNTLSFAELNSWTTTNFLSPLDGTILKANNNPTLYWVVGQVLHPINWNFFLDRGLNIFPIMVVPGTDIAGYAQGEAYIR